MEPYYSIADFQNDARQRLATIAASAMAEHRIADGELKALIEAARNLCRDELIRNGRFALHGLDQDADGVVPSDEAYLSLAAAGPGEGRDWVSLTFWLSELALADRDPGRVRGVIAAIDRTQEKLRAWLAAEEAKLADEAANVPQAPPAA